MQTQQVAALDRPVIVAKFDEKTQSWVLGAEGKGSETLLSAVLIELGDHVIYVNQRAELSYKNGGFLAETVSRVANKLQLTDWRTRFE